LDKVFIMGKPSDIVSNSKWYKSPAAWFFILNIILIPLVFTTAALDPALSGRYVIWVLAGLVFLSFGFVRLNEKQTGSLRLTDPVLWVYMILLVSALISLSVAINLNEAVSELLKMTVLPVFVLTGLLLVRKNDNWKGWLIRSVVVYGLIHSLIAIVQLIGLIQEEGFSHASSYLVRGLSAHRNLLSEMLVMSLPFSLAAFVLQKNVWKWAGLFSFIMSLVVVILLLTKTAWLAFIIASLFTLILFLNYYPLFEFGRKVWLKVAAGCLIFGVLTGMVLFIYTRIDSWETLEKQTYWLRNYKFGSSLERVDLWEKSMHMYRDHIFTGVGTGNWKVLLPSYGNDGLRSEEGQIFFTRPHNDFVGVLAENGIIGFFAYSLFFLILLFYTVRAVKKGETPGDKLFALFLFAGVLSYLVIALLSFPRERIEHTILLGFLTLSAILINRRKENFNPTPKPVIHTLIVVGLLFLVANAVSAFGKYQGEVNLKKAMIARSNGDWQKVVSYADKAENIFFTIDNTTIPISWYSGLAYYNLGQTDLAFGKFTTAMRFHPYNLHVLNNLGSCYAVAGNPSEAKKLYREAMAISSRFEDARLNLTAVLYNESAFDSAMAVFKSIPKDCGHPNYEPTLSALLNLKFRELLTLVEEPELLATIRRIQKDPVWSKSVFQNANDNNEDFGDRVIRESVYVLFDLDSAISQSEAIRLESKYINRNIQDN
jgi:O-antigen ligase